jgi:3-keto-disaccharide hydrolase
MRTKNILSLTLLISLSLFVTRALGEAAEGGKSLITKDMSGWKLKDANNTQVWKIDSDVKLDSDPKKLMASTDAVGDSPVLFRQPVEHGTDLYTEQEFGDCEVHIEFMVPKNSNSGVYLMGRYEVQVLDSFGKPDNKLGTGDVGSVYNTSKPSSNASKAPGEWQSFDIVFQAPRFENGKKTQNAKFISVKLNGKEVNSNVEVKGGTGGQIRNEEAEKGPLLLQGDHGIVGFRNIRVKETK